MTTDNIKAVIRKWHANWNAWPTKSELVQTLLAMGFVVDSAELDDLLGTLCAANELQVINGTFVI